VTTYERAAFGYDDAHERDLLNAITAAIIQASKVSDCDVIALRTGEAASALVSALALVLAMSPSAVRSPTSIRKMLDELRRRLRRRVADATTNADLQDSLARVFRDDVEGNA
jgi:hypothetical protein